MAAAAPAILVFGDSLSAAYGIAEKRGWATLLQQRLQRDRLDYSVVNASISGETTSGGVTRLRRALEQHKPAVVILQLGANDGLRGLPIAQMKQNLGAMIEMAQKTGARVLLVGLRMPPNYGPDYTRSFESAYDDLAKKYRTAQLQFMFEGFAENLAMFQSDRLHPTEDAQPLLLENIWKPLRPLLKL